MITLQCNFSRHYKALDQIVLPPSERLLRAQLKFSTHLNRWNNDIADLCPKDLLR